MPVGSKYKIIDILNENDTLIISRALRLKDNKSVILKALKTSARNENSLSHFKNEQNILPLFRSKNIIKLLDVISLPSEYIHVLEDIHATSIYDLLLNRIFSVQEALNIAFSLVKTLNIIHQKEIIHADISPKNIIYNTSTKELQIIDFGYSISKGSLKSDTGEIKSGTLFYMSPEQTGLTQTRMDERSDLYSLGMTLYHLFLGNSPFEAIDKIELIHKQIALHPKSLHKLNSSIPPVISDIIDKLIKKSPNERYQSCNALEYDIRQCINSINSSGKIKEFLIATQNHQSIHIGDKLFGRENELILLKELAHKRLDETSIRVLVSGHAGTGKTRLVEEFLNYLDPRKVRIIRGSFEQHKSSYPYLIFKQLLSQVHTLLMSQNIRLDFSSLCKRSASVLSFIFPELGGLLSAKKKSYLPLNSSMNNQLSPAFKDFFKLIATKESPLLIFMDNLQWADEASITLLQDSLINTENPYVSIILSYRDSEIKENKQAYKLIQSFSQDKKIKSLDIKLSALNEDALGQMIEDIFREKSKKISTLARLLYKKTGGNPFYVQSFIKHLIDEGDLYFEKGRWKFSLEKIDLYKASVNIAHIISSKFEKTGQEEQNFLQHLCILGNRFDIGLTLKMMKSLGFRKDLFDKARADEFINYDEKEYRFVHDQIQEHIFNSVNENRKRHIHLSISKYLEPLYKEGSYSDIISLVNHLNRAYAQDKLPQKLFALNIKALEEMLFNNAYSLALETSRWIQTCLEKSYFKKPSSALLFHSKCLNIKILYLNSLHKEAFKEIQLLIEHSVNIDERLSCFTIFKDISVTQGKHFNDLLLFGNELLETMGLQTPHTHKELSLYVKVLQEKIRNHDLVLRPDKIMKLPLLKKKSYQHILSLLVDYWEGAYYLADIERMQWAYLTIIDFSFKYGNSSQSGFAYLLYGAQLVSQQDYKKAHDFAEVALKLNDRFNDKEMLPKVHNFVANYINPYNKTLLSNVSLYQKSLDQSKINADLVFGTWANFLMHFSQFLSGKQLETCRQEISKESSFILESGDTKMISIFKILTQTIEKLQDTQYSDEQDEESAIAIWEDEKFYPALAWYAVLKAQECFLDERYEKGLYYLDTYVHTTANEVIMFPKIRLHFIRALLLMGTRKPLTPQQQLTLRNDMDEYESFYKSSPSTFKFERILLKAESNKHFKSPWDTAKQYDLALKEAQKQKNPFYHALSGLCASRFWKRLHYSELSQFYFDEAIIGLNRWGAYAKAKHLKILVPKHMRRLEDLSESISSSSSQASQSNFQALIKAFFKITQAQDNAQLVTSLMQTILETATASKAVLIFKENEVFKIKAATDFKEASTSLYDLDIEDSSLIPNSIISYAINTKERLILNNPSLSGKFQTDPYIKSLKPASCLVLHSSLEGSIQAVLYLENQDIATPLNPATIKTLELLLTQASIVFKNTSLHETLEESANNLTMAQEISHVGSWQYNFIDRTFTCSAETYHIYELKPFSMEIDYEWFVKHLHPDDVDHVQETVSGAVKESCNFDISHRIITSKGNNKTVYQRAEVYFDAGVKKMAGTIQDITESAQSQELIYRLSQVLEQNPFTTIITDINSTITHVNAQTHKMTGYTDEELLGKNMNIFSSGEHSASFYKDLWKTIKEKKSIWRGTLINKMKNGDLQDCRSTIFPVFDTHHKIISFVTIQEDVTQSNIREKLFLMQTRQAQMGEMLSMIAHQWRQPLSIILALVNNERVNIILEKSNNDTLINNYDAIETQISHLSHTISDFRDFFKPDKEATLTKSSRIIEKSFSLVEHVLQKHNIRVNIEYIIDSSFKSYEHEIEQVVLNLINNAKDALIERQIKDPFISVITDEIGDNALISIEDNAKGVDISIINTLFLPYISTKKETQGTGLGLYMCKTIIEEHCHGTISVENTELGSRFTLQIPLKDIRG